MAVMPGAIRIKVLAHVEGNEPIEVGHVDLPVRTQVRSNKMDEPNEAVKVLIEAAERYIELARENDESAHVHQKRAAVARKYASEQRARAEEMKAAAEALMSINNF